MQFFEIELLVGCWTLWGFLHFIILLLWTIEVTIHIRSDWDSLEEKDIDGHF
jgi:hypothetical protein